VRQIVSWLATLAVMLVIAGCGSGTRAKHVSFADLVANPDGYRGREICTEGVYASGFEVSALGASTYQENASVYLTAPAIWIEGANIVSRQDCFSAGANPPVEFCRVTVCGVFEAGAGYGHAGAYEFQIRG
jgi:hypothetical protein